MVCWFLVLQSDMPIVSIRFRNISPTQDDPGLEALVGAYGQLQPLGNANLWKPCYAWTAGRPLTHVISIMMCNYYLNAPHFGGPDATGLGIS